MKKNVKLLLRKEKVSALNERQKQNIKGGVDTQAGCVATAQVLKLYILLLLDVEK